MRLHLNQQNLSKKHSFPTYVIMDYIQYNFGISPVFSFELEKLFFCYYLLFKGNFMSLGLILSTSLLPSILVSDLRDFAIQSRLPGLILTPHYPKVKLELKNLILSITLSLNFKMILFNSHRFNKHLLNVFFLAVFVWRVWRRRA